MNCYHKKVIEHADEGQLKWFPGKYLPILLLVSNELQLHKGQIQSVQWSAILLLQALTTKISSAAKVVFVLIY